MSAKCSTFYVVSTGNDYCDAIAKVTHDVDKLPSQHHALEAYRQAALKWAKEAWKDQDQPLDWYHIVVNWPAINKFSPDVKVQYFANWEHIFLLDLDTEADRELE